MYAGNEDKGGVVITTAAIWRYGRHELPHLARTGMEIALVVPFCLAFMPWARFWSPWAFAVFAAVLMLLPFNLLRLMDVMGVSVGKQRGVLLGSLLLVLGVSIRMLLYDGFAWWDVRWMGEVVSHLNASGYPFWARDFLLLFFILYLWGRGVGLTQKLWNIEALGLQFRMRALLFAPVVVYLATTRLLFDITPFVVLFCLCSVLMLAVVRAEQVEREATGMAFPITPRWLGMIGGASVAVCFVGVLLASATTADSILGAPQLAVRFLSYTVFFVVANLIGPLLFETLNWLAVVLGVVFRPIAQALYEFEGLEDVLPEDLGADPNVLPEDVPVDLSFLPALLVVGFVTLLVVSIVLMVRRRLGDNGVMREVGVAPRPLADTSAQQGGGNNGGLWGRLRGLAQGWRDWRTAASIRRIYQQMVSAATEQGYPRGRAETPYEYLARLHGVWPHHVAQTGLITEAYVRVRYGELPETAQELEEIRVSWRVLVAALQESEAVKGED